METHLAKKDQAKEINDEEQDIVKKEVMAKKKPNFEAQDPLMEVNLGTEKAPKVTKISGLLPKKKSKLTNPTHHQKISGLFCLGLP